MRRWYEGLGDRRPFCETSGRESAKIPPMDTIPPDPRQVTDNEHLRLLSLFHYVVGGMVALFACLPIFHLVMGLILIKSPQIFGPSNQQPPAFFGWFFVIMATFFILAGWTFAVLVWLTGRNIARRTRYTYCFVMAGVECIFMPFGTVLGVFTILVLNRQSVKDLFTPRPVI
jgi:hypothetical protein